MSEHSSMNDRQRQLLARPLPPGLKLLPPREPDGHKGTYGRALLVGGSLGMAGAMGLAGRATLRAGAGLVRLAVPKSIVGTVASYEPAYMTAPLPEDVQGRLSAAAVEPLLEMAGAVTALAVGPGLGRSAELNKLVARLFAEISQPAVFDADALNALSEQRDALGAHAGPRVLTPHPGEFQRLVGDKPLASREAMQEAAQHLAARSQCVVVLKGHRTFVTDGDRSYTNTTGNPGMATGGTGDVLTGVTTGLLCQGLTPLDAACLAVFVHGLAGDLGAAELGEVSLTATDLIRYLPFAVQRVIAGERSA